MAEVKNIFNFLKEYNELLNPIITEIDRQIWHYKLSDVPKIKDLWSVYDAQDLNELKILEIKRPDLKPCPPPDKFIIEWIQGEWESLDIEIIKYREKIIRKVIEDDGSITQYEEYFTDDENRLNSFEEWIEKREEWRNIEIPKRQGLKLYNELFKLYSEIKRESESVELMLGDGHIRWTTVERFIDHPVLLQKVNLEFNPDKPSFIIKCDELKTELYTSMLRVIPSINQSMLPNVIQEAENIYHIADKDNNIEFFKRLINVVDRRGKYVENSKNTHDEPIIMHDPIFFLRKRTLGYSIFIDSIIDDIERNDNKDFPGFFENMVGNYREHTNNDNIQEDWNHNGIDQDVLLTLPANSEQLKIIKYLDNYGAVLVQGPPGTGKTHTIANLIGHLLSEGKNVLVTSHTEKALTVLKDKVFNELQSLCISLLTTSSQKKEMDATLFEIAEKSTAIDLSESKKKVNNLETERKDLIDKYKAKNQELIQIRSLDYKDIVYANETITPIDAAKFVNQGKEKYDYIPGISNDDSVSIPLSNEELIELYESNEQITNKEEMILGNDLPDFNDIWSIDELDRKVKEYIKYKELVEDWSPRLTIIDEVNKGTILDLLDEAKIIKESLNKLEDYQCYILTKSIQDTVYVGFWEEVINEYVKLKDKYEDYIRILFEKDYDIPDELIIEDTLSILDEIINTNKEVPVSWICAITKPKWKKLSNSITVNNEPIEKLDNYKDVKTIISYEIKRNILIGKINKLLGEVSRTIDFKTNDIELKLESFIKKAKLSLNWYKTNWISYTSKVQKYLVELNKYNELCVVDLEQPIQSMDNMLNDLFIIDLLHKYNYILLGEIKSQINTYEEFLEKYRTNSNLFNEFIKSIEEKDVNKYGIYYEKIRNVYAKKEIYLKRTTLLERLAKIAPNWAEAIRNRDGIHGKSTLPENIELAWKWNQLNNQINRINSYDPNAIQKDINKINELLIENARELAYEKAWYHKIKNTTDEQTQAIQGWRQTMKQLGKGTGKKAPMLLKKARELMPLCQTAIPVWIMPLNRVAENFDPQRNKFDVVIIDEASQADILALSGLYLGKKIIIVGDDEQVSPSSVGIKTDEIKALTEQYLQGIPLNHLYNGESSIYDIAQSSGFKQLMLTEHFRCLPEIIEFSNGMSYNYKIKPLRDASQVKIKPAVVPYRVPGGHRSDDKINKIEAEHIASLICACVENEEYDGKTIGVISLLGQEQAYEIDKLLQINLDPKEYESRKIQCGTPAQFQGDERDVIFLSIVEGPNENGGPVRLVSESGRNDMYRKRYNVAASRAKDQMWVVHSLNPEIDLKPEDIRFRLIKHAMNPSISEHEEQLKHAESDFEIEVMKRLQSKGYKVYAQWKVGSYRIDMVVEDGEKRIAIECDGERWHTIDNLADDMKRQAILERLGWRFIRIRGSQFYREPDKTMEWVFEELDRYDIKPNYIGGDEINNEEKYELCETIKRQANEIRMVWNGEVAEVESVLLEEDVYFEGIEDDGYHYEIKDEDERSKSYEIIYESLSNPINNKTNDKSKYVFNKDKRQYGIKDTSKINLDQDNVRKNINVPLFDFRKK